MAGTASIELKAADLAEIAAALATSRCRGRVIRKYCKSAGPPGTLRPTPDQAYGPDTDGRLDVAETLGQEECRS
jgi:hypothetical protein